MSTVRKVNIKAGFEFKSSSCSPSQDRGIGSENKSNLTRSLPTKLVFKGIVQNRFIDWACKILNTQTPAILVLTDKRELVYANTAAKAHLLKRSIVSVNVKGVVSFTDHASQNYLINSDGDNCKKLSAMEKDDYSFLIPTSTGWPIAVQTQTDQFDLKEFRDLELDHNQHVTLLMRNSGDEHRGGKSRLKSLFKGSLAGKGNLGEALELGYGN